MTDDIKALREPPPMRKGEVMGSFRTDLGTLELRMYKSAEVRARDAQWQSRIDKVLALLDEARKDAERYRWLRDTPWLDTPIQATITLQKNALWDAAIDAAMNEPPAPDPQ